jgi:hypothetical protein
MCIQQALQRVAVVLVGLATGLSACRPLDMPTAPLAAPPLSGIRLASPPLVHAPELVSPPAIAWPLPLPKPHAIVVTRSEPTDTEDTDRIQQNAIFGTLLETRFAVELKAHVVLPTGLEVFIYSGRETDVAVDGTVLADVLAGRFQFLDTLTDPRYEHSLAEAKRRLDQHDFQGYSLHVVLSGQPQSCIVYSDAHTPLYRPLIVTYPDDPSTRRCQAVGYTINYPYTIVHPQIYHPATKRTIAGVILTPTADAAGRYRNTEQPSKLRVELPASAVYGFTIGHEFLHTCVGYFDDNPILNTYSEERQIQLLDTAYYQVYAGLVAKPMPFRVTRKAAAPGDRSISLHS